ncbi:hypothetical protein GCM10027299_24580 [Larkinella ripae]
MAAVKTYLIEQAKKLLTKRLYLSNRELLNFLDGNEEVLKQLRFALIQEGFAEDEKQLGIKLNQSGSRRDDFDIFISYARKDSAYVEKIVDKIRETHALYSPFPLRLFLDKDEIKGMDDWERKILEALKSSKVMIAVLSPNYFGSPYCQKEWQHFVDLEVEKALVGEAVSPLYTITIPEYETMVQQSDAWKEDVKKRQFSDIRDWWKEGLEESIERSINKVFEELDNQMDRRIIRSELQALSKASFNSSVPPHNPNFVGRTDLLRKVRTSLQTKATGTIVALQGLPGIGKSSVAYEYAHINYAYYTGGVFLVRAASLANLRDAIIGLAPDLGLDITHMTNLDQAHKTVLHQLNERGKVLILFDNLDPEKLAMFSRSERNTYLPSSNNIHIYVTTRAAEKDLESIGLEVLNVDKLDQRASISLLSKFKSFIDEEELQAARKIVELLDGYPIALEIVGSYVWFCRDRNLTYGQYYADLKARNLTFLDKSGAEGPDLANSHQKVFSELLKPYFLNLDIHQKFILKFCTELSPDSIPEWWLEDVYLATLLACKALFVDHADVAEVIELRTKLFPAIENIEEDPEVREIVAYFSRTTDTLEETFAKSIRKLKGFQLLNTTAETGILAMHRLIHSSIQPEKEDHRFKEDIYQYIFTKCENLINKKLWFKKEHQRDINALMSFLEYKIPTQGYQYWGAIIAISAAYLEIGDVFKPKNLLEKLYAVLYTFDSRIFVLNKLKDLYRKTGEIEEIKRCEAEINRLTRLLEEHKPKSSGDENEERFLEEIRQVNEHYQSGRWDEGIELCRRIIPAYEQQDLSDDRHKLGLADLKNTYAILCSRKGLMAESIQQEKESIRLIEAVYPDGAPVLATKYLNLAATYSQVADEEQIRVNLNKASFQIEKYSLQNSFLYAIWLKLSAILEADLNVALDLTKKSIAIMVDLMGPDTPELAHSYRQLCVYETTSGNYNAALDAIEKAIQIFEKVYGETHPELIGLYIELYKTMCLYHTSDEVLERVEQQEKTYREQGVHFPNTSMMAFRMQETGVFLKIGELLKGNNLPEDTFFFGELHLITGMTQLKRRMIVEGIQSLGFSYIVFGRAIGEENPHTQAVLKRLEGELSNHIELLYQENTYLEVYYFLIEVYKVLFPALGMEHILIRKVTNLLDRIIQNHFEDFPDEIQENLMKSGLVQGSKKDEEPKPDEPPTRKGFWGKIKNAFN